MRSRRRWRVLAFGAVLLGAGGLGVAPSVQAQEGPSAAELAAQFGGFDLRGRGSAVQLTYNVENVFPLPAPIIQVSVPEAQTTLSTGPSAVALGSLAYPGNLLANLPGLVSQAAPDFASFVPPYPIMARAEYPSGPPTAEQSIGTAAAAVGADATAAESNLALAGIDVPGIITVGAITSSSRSALLEGSTESRVRIELGDVDVLFGLLHIDSIVTDIVAASNGVEGASAGGTTVTGATLLGVPVTIDQNGLTAGEPSAPENPGPLTPLFDNLPDLGPLSDGLNGIAGPVNDVVTSILGQATGTVGELLSAAGISIRVLEPVETLSPGGADRVANGLFIDITFDGRGDNPLAQLLSLVPSELLPSQGIPGLPVNLSPQALVNLVKETHVTGFALAFGSVSAVATEAFTFEPEPFTPAAPSNPPSVPLPGTSAPTPNFATPSPPLATGGGGTVPSGGAPISTTDTTAGAFGIGAMVAVALLLGSPAFWFGSTKLVDAVLDEAVAGCPEGR